MIRGIYTAISGMIVQENRQNVISNNVANVSTDGFKGDDLIAHSFKDVLISNQDNKTNNRYTELGKISLGTSLAGIHTNFDIGMPKETGIDTNFALTGKGFFALDTPKGVKYTRDGNFQVDQRGYLVSSDGYYVKDKNSQNIYVGNGKIEADDSGNLTITQQNGVKSNASLMVMDFDDYTKLNKVGQNLFEGDNARPVTSGIKQKAVEGSNVSITDEIMDMMEVKRNFETNQKIVKILDENLDKLISKVGSTRG